MATKEAAASGEVQLLEAAGVRVPAAGEAVIRAVVPPLTAGVGLLATTPHTRAVVRQAGDQRLDMEPLAKVVNYLPYLKAISVKNAHGMCKLLLDNKH